MTNGGRTDTEGGGRTETGGGGTAPEVGPVGADTEGPTGVDPLDVVVVGAGFAGLYLLYRCRELGLSARAFEAGHGVGGTWYWNRYPGARCDVESLQYSYSFSDELQQEWEWSERYATQPEILRYLEHVADRFDLRRDITFATRVTSARWDDVSSTWSVRTDAGEEVTASFVVLATGCLSSANLPDIPGRDSFAGATYHTGQWPHEGVDFTGLRVGVIGTGSSAVQSIPLIAEQAAELTVFQRTATYCVPAHNRPLDPDEVDAVKADYRAFREENKQSMTAIGSRVLPRTEDVASRVGAEEIQRRFDERWEHGGLPFLGAFSDLIVDPASNELAAAYVRAKIRDLVADPAVADRLTPRTVIGCKRLCVDTGYYETFNRPNVRLVDVGEHPIDEITPTGVRVGDTAYDLDAIVFATGFDAMTGAIAKIDIVGRAGTTMREHWAAGPLTYLGLGVHGFPNLFLVTGPGSPSVLTNMIVSIEHHVGWITDCIATLRATGRRAIEATAEAEHDWVTYVNSVASFTLLNNCNSWYLGANVPGKPRVFMPLIGFPPYAEQCADIAADDYRGFAVI